MGFPNSSHITKFLTGQTIVEVTSDERGHHLWFESGERLRFYAHPDGVICTPFDADGEVKQSTAILHETTRKDGE